MDMADAWRSAALTATPLAVRITLYAMAEARYRRVAARSMGQDRVRALFRRWECEQLALMDMALWYWWRCRFDQ